MCRAELAWRLPPRLRRWRCVFPLDAGDRADAAHHGEARLGAEPIRVIPNGDHYCACVLGAHAFELKQTGGELLDQGDDEPVEFSDLVVDVEDSAGEGLQGELGRDHRVSIADRVQPPGRTGTQALHAGEVADLVTHFLRCGNDGVVELLQGRAAALDCRLSRCSQHPQGFHGAGTVFGHLDPASCVRRLGRERLTGALLDRLTHHVNILEMNGDSYRLNQSRRRQTPTAN